MRYRYLFGPISSRRLGMSLGIDVIPYKTCTLDCVYCECGPTTDLTVQRQQYVAPEDVIEELDDYLSTHPDLDYITFSGSGEPTLYRGIAEIVAFIRQFYPMYKTALLTNGTLLSDSEVREEIMDIDLILPSFDAGSMASFRAINRPHPSLDIEDLKQGIKALRKEYAGTLWLEVFIVPGINDSEDELDLLRDEISSFGADMVYVNTLDRPGAESWVRKVPPEKLKDLSAHIAHKSAITHLEENVTTPVDEKTCGAILSLIGKRPRTATDISSSLQIDMASTTACLDRLMDSGKVSSELRGMNLIFMIRK